MKTKIIDYGYNCEGVGKTNGKVCFVPFALKDEEVEFEKTKETSSFIKGKLEKVLQASDKRIQAPCKYFGKCGGCMLQNIHLEEENEIKKSVIASHFSKLGYTGKIIVVSKNDYFYRNKIKLFCGSEGLGLKEMETDNIVPIDRCIICSKRINECILHCQNFVKAQGLEKNIENVIIRSEGEDALILFDFKSDVETNFQGLQIILGKGSGIYKSVAGGQPVHILGEKNLKENFLGVDISYSPSSFKQVNDLVAKKLYEDVIRSVKGNEVVNAYSGAGLLTALIAKSGKKCSGIEIGKSEHNDAEKLKATNHISKMINYRGDCCDMMGKVVTDFTSTIIVDPARRGCDSEVMKVINESKAERVIYISCDPATQVRDLKLLSNFEIVSIALYNMFPCTGRSECLVILDNKKLAKKLQEKSI